MPKELYAAIPVILIKAVTVDKAEQKGETKEYMSVPVLTGQHLFLTAMLLQTPTTARSTRPRCARRARSATPTAVRCRPRTAQP